MVGVAASIVLVLGAFAQWRLAPEAKTMQLLVPADTSQIWRIATVGLMPPTPHGSKVRSLHFWLFTTAAYVH